MVLGALMLLRTMLCPKNGPCADQTTKWFNATNGTAITSVTHREAKAKAKVHPHSAAAAAAATSVAHKHHHRTALGARSQDGES